MQLLFSATVVVVYIVLVEYVAHRWVMHKPFPWRTGFYFEHAIEHHGKQRYDINTAIHPITCFYGAAPLFVASIWCGWALTITTAAACFIYSWLWSSLHTAHHDLGCQWIKTLPFYERLRSHHLKHHEQPNRNYGAVFIFSDYLFRTKFRSDSRC